MYKTIKIVLIIVIIICITNLLNGQAIYLDSSFSGYNTSNINITKEEVIDYYMTIEIPNISLKKYIFDIGDIRNNIDLNVQLLYKDNPIILVSHSGNGSNAYFKNLKYLEIGDYVYIYLDNNKQKYYVSKIYSINKNEDFGIDESLTNKLILITCLNKKQYLVIECQRQTS